MTGPASGTRRAILLRRPGTSRRGQDMANDGGRRRFRSRFSRAAMRAWTMDNKLFALALTGRLLLRVDTELGYRWQVWFNDSFTYVRAAVTKLKPDTTRPSGYPIFLKILAPTAQLTPLVTTSQHLMGLARRGHDLRAGQVPVRRAALGRHAGHAAGAFDGFEIQLEHLILSGHARSCS